MLPYRNYEEKFPLDGKMVYVPTSATRAFGVHLVQWIARRWRVPRHFYHLGRRGGHVAAARNHLSDQFFLTCDLSRCFDHITRSKIHRALKSLGFSHKDAWEFACKSVVAKPDGAGVLSLPFGFPQSPILASLAIDRSALGAVLKHLSRTSVRLSMYMDDMLLSALGQEPLEQAFGTIVEAAEQSGFAINADKTVGPAEAVEAFNLRLTNGNLSVSERRMSMFEEAVRSSNFFVVEGIVGYVGTINADQAAQLRLASSSGAG